MRALWTLLALGAMTSGPAAQTETDRRAPDAEKQKLFDRLISAVWCDQQVVISTPFGDFTQWQLRPDGTYRYDFLTDTDPWPHGEGRWDLERSAEGWVLALDSGARHRLALDANGGIRIDALPLRPCQATHAATRDVAGLPQLALPPFVSSLRDRVVGPAWLRANDLDLGFRPTSVTFARGWSYTSVYRFGACRNSGAWRMERGEIVTHADRNPCNERDPAYPEVLRFRLWANGDLVAGGDRYVLKPDRSRGRWTLASYEDSVEVTIDYPMPLRRGKPQLFRFGFVNRSGEVRTLERIALNTVHRDYRYRTRGLETPELAALDLKQQPLQPGESADFELPVVFDSAGTQGIYFDALIVGSRQNWDTRQARQVTVHP